MKQLHYICAQPDDDYYFFQIHLWIENLKSLGVSDKAIVLLYTPQEREKNKKYEILFNLYPEVKFFTHRDESGELRKLLPIYIPILRPFMLHKYWTEHPEMKDEVVFYYDCDVLLTKDFSLDAFLDDDVCYVSDTRSYLNATYFDSKIKDVLPQKLENYKKIDVLDNACKLVGITRQIAEKYNEDTGGAQYLLKNIDASFWKKMITDVINIRVYLQEVNRTYFESENKGTQSWCADMWALLWQLWARNQEVKVIKEMNFAWAPDPIEKLNTHTIFHNAGINADFMYGYPCFYKGKYVGGNSPTKDPHLDVVLNNEESKKHCTWWYATKIDELRRKFPDIYI